LNNTANTRFQERIEYWEKKSQGNIFPLETSKKATDEAITLFSNKGNQVVTMPDYEAIEV
jgi:hypothetical protein